ncbi:hypothetical protein TWF696_001049 [Orbilia brochopaga]|uniref:Uncharacterized protein n=1 Tax=Orbilia brochopaga TaxID=3140254 RepID=A0AAV9VD73_9PEZI
MARLVALLVILSLLGPASTAPATQAAVTPEEVDYTKILIPGPGLPSVQELGLTNADLLKPHPAIYNTTTTLAGSGKPTCAKRPYKWCRKKDANACLNFLESFGSAAIIGISGGGSSLCKANKCNWMAKPQGGRTTSSYVKDIAIGGKKILQGCKNKDSSKVQGRNAARGNSNFIIEITGTS